MHMGMNPKDVNGTLWQVVIPMHMGMNPKTTLTYL